MRSSTLKFVLPATLVVTTFAVAGGCSQDPQEGEGDSQAADGDADSSDGGEVYCGDLADMAACATQSDCGWSEAFGECVHVCMLATTQAECEAIEVCTWEPEGDSSGICFGPFT